MKIHPVASATALVAFRLALTMASRSPIWVRSMRGGLRAGRPKRPRPDVRAAWSDLADQPNVVTWTSIASDARRHQRVQGDRAPRPGPVSTETNPRAIWTRTSTAAQPGPAPHRAAGASTFSAHAASQITEEAATRAMHPVGEVECHERTVQGRHQLSQAQRRVRACHAGFGVADQRAQHRLGEHQQRGDQAPAAHARSHGGAPWRPARAPTPRSKPERWPGSGRGRPARDASWTPRREA